MTEAHLRELTELRRGSGCEVACALCGQKLTERKLGIGGKAFTFGHNPCDCPAYMEAHKILLEEEVAKERTRAAILHQDKINRLFGESNLGARFRDRTFENYKAETPWQRAALQVAEEFVCEMVAAKAKQGILFSGDVGTGKTHLAAAIANALISGGTPVLFGTSSGLLAQIRQGWKSETDAQIVQTLCRIPLLVIDDLGKEYAKKTDGWSWAQEQFFNVVNSRYENYLPTVITTNLSPAELAETLGKAIVSRLIESCRGVLCNGADYRMRRGI